MAQTSTRKKSSVGGGTRRRSNRSTRGSASSSGSRSTRNRQSRTGEERRKPERFMGVRGERQRPPRSSAELQRPATPSESFERQRGRREGAHGGATPQPRSGRGRPAGVRRGLKEGVVGCPAQLGARSWGCVLTRRGGPAEHRRHQYRARQVRRTSGQPSKMRKTWSDRKRSRPAAHEVLLRALTARR
jgi:hypothetical protein